MGQLKPNRRQQGIPTKQLPQLSVSAPPQLRPPPPPPCAVPVTRDGVSSDAAAGRG